jgi:predicted nucleic acid-binding protein
LRKLKLYLETSVWSYFYADDTPEKRDITREFLAILDSFEVCIAEPVLREINNAPGDLRNRLIELIGKHRPVLLDFEPPVDELARAYLKTALPAASEMDALHVAYATFYELDFVISWNMKHIANVGRQEKVRVVNRDNGYTKDLMLISPFEVSRYAS